MPSSLPPFTKQPSLSHPLCPSSLSPQLLVKLCQDGLCGRQMLRSWGTEVCWGVSPMGGAANSKEPYVGAALAMAGGGATHACQGPSAWGQGQACAIAPEPPRTSMDLSQKLAKLISGGWPVLSKRDSERLLPMVLAYLPLRAESNTTARAGRKEKAGEAGVQH